MKIKHICLLACSLLFVFALSGCSNGNVKVDISEETKTGLEQLYTNLNAYIDKREAEDATFVTRYGFLFDQTNDEYIDADLLYYEGYYNDLDEIDPISGTSLMYVRNKDMQGIDGITAPEDNNFSLYFCYPPDENNEKENYYVYSKDYGVGGITKQKFEEIKEVYNVMHGEIYTPEVGSKICNNILNAINDFEGKQTQYDVKYIKADAKYAIIVIQNLEDLMDVKQYILNIENEPKVLLDNLAKEENIHTKLNIEYPDYPLVIIPEYTLSNYVFKTEFSKVYDAMMKNGIITSEDLPATYAFGADDYVYFEMQNDKKFVGTATDDGELYLYPVKDADEAESYLYEFEDMPPIFIIKRS